MKIGYYVQGDTDEAVVWGLARRWCPDAALAPGRFRGSSKESFRRELRKALMDLAGRQACDVVVVLTDADVNAWRDVKTRETAKIPDEYGHLILFGGRRSEHRMVVGCRPWSPRAGAGLSCGGHSGGRTALVALRQAAFRLDGTGDAGGRQEARAQVCPGGFIATLDSRLGLVRGLLRRSPWLGCPERVPASERAGGLTAWRSGGGS